MLIDINIVRWVTLSSGGQIQHESCCWSLNMARLTILTRLPSFIRRKKMQSGYYLSMYSSDQIVTSFMGLYLSPTCHSTTFLRCAPSVCLSSTGWHRTIQYDNPLATMVSVHKPQIFSYPPWWWKHACISNTIPMSKWLWEFQWISWQTSHKVMELPAASINCLCSPQTKTASRQTRNNTRVGWSMLQLNKPNKKKKEKLPNWAFCT